MIKSRVVLARGQRWQDGWTAKRHEKSLAEWEMFCVLVGILQTLTTVKTHWAEYFKWMQFITHNSFFNKVDKEKNTVMETERSKWFFSSISYPKNNSSQTHVQSSGQTATKCNVNSKVHWFFSSSPFPFLLPWLLPRLRNPLTACHGWTSSSRPPHWLWGHTTCCLHQLSPHKAHLILYLDKSRPNPQQLPGESHLDPSLHFLFA